MAAHDASGSGVWSTGTTFSWSHTIAAGGLLLVWVGFRNHALVSVSGVTVAGSAMTFMGSVQNAGGANRLELWKHESPSTGSVTIEVTLSASPTNAIGCSASATSTGSFGAAITAGPTSSTTPSVTITSLGGSDLPYGGVMTLGNPTEQDTLVVEATSSRTVNVERQATGGDGILNWTQGVPDEWLAIGCRAIDGGGGGATGQPTMTRWGGVPHVGGRSALGRRGGAWGRRESGVWVPNHLREAA